MAVNRLRRSIWDGDVFGKLLFFCLLLPLAGLLAVLTHGFDETPGR